MHRISNGTIELEVAQDIGPRIMRFALVGGPNIFGTTEGGRGDWRVHGGHRLWHAPESDIRSYVPDNDPVHIEPLPDGISIRPPLDTVTRIQKVIDLHWGSRPTDIHVVHRLTNERVWPVRLAPWALTVMAPGGVAV